MKKLLPAAKISMLCFFICLLCGCLKDQCSNTYTMYRPIYKTLTQVRADMKSGTATPLKNTGKLFIYGKYIFLNEVNKGIHVIDNSDPAQPKNVSFIAIPGNVDLAVKDDLLYADAYADLVVFDISNPQNITAKKFVTNVFPDRSIYYSVLSANSDSVNVVVGYNAKDTTVDCSTYNKWKGCASCMFVSMDAGGFFTTAAANPAPVSQGGSMARFSIVNNYLYTVSTSQLYTFDISNAVDPKLEQKTNINSSIETIFPFKDQLFIGSTTGMFIYKVSNGGSPQLVSQFGHVRSCDPVIADDKNAFVTLRSGTVCQGFSNQLEVLDIAQLTMPALLKTYGLTNPHGLSKDGDLLFICDGKDGLKIYDAADVMNLKLLKTFSGIETYDVIAANGNALVVASDGLYQYNYNDKNNIRLTSKISITK